MAIKKPLHPGYSVRYDCLEPLGLSVTKGAQILGVTRQALNNLVNAKAGISPEMAVRLDKAFGGTAEGWLSLQTAFDLAQVRKHAHSINVKRYAGDKELVDAR
jgi:addiction module HigA family antidote